MQEAVILSSEKLQFIFNGHGGSIRISSVIMNFIKARFRAMLCYKSLKIIVGKGQNTK